MKKNRKTSVNINDIINYEQGLLSVEDTIKLFQGLIDSGLVHKLQGHYGRTAQNLMEQGYVKPSINHLF